MSCTITLDGLALYRYTKGLMGWGERSSITGERGELVTFDTRNAAQQWIDRQGQFARDAAPAELDEKGSMR